MEPSSSKLLLWLLSFARDDESSSSGEDRGGERNVKCVGSKQIHFFKSKQKSKTLCAHTYTRDRIK